MSSIDELTRLHELFVKGAITGDEFARMKAAIIADPTAASNGKPAVSQPASALSSGASIAYLVAGGASIAWIIYGLFYAIQSIQGDDINKSRALGVGLVLAHIAPTLIVARFLIGGRRNATLGLAVLAADAVLLAASVYLLHLND